MATILFVYAGFGRGQERPSPPPAGISPCNGRIVFVANNVGSDEFDIHSVRPDGTGRVNLTLELPASASGPVWSPDGKKIAFAGTVEDPQNMDIYVMNSNGSQVRRLTSHPEADTSPEWSPDGERITFISSRGGMSSDIYVMRADGSEQIPLTFDWHMQSSPTWSPDGSTIAFVSNHETASKGEVYRMRIGGSVLARITADSWAYNSVDWSPDGRWLLVESVKDGRGEILLLRPDGLKRVRLTKRVRGGSPAWSPDGAAIVFTEVRTSGLGISVMRADGSGVRRIPSLSSQEGFPDWQPTGAPGCSRPREPSTVV